MKNKNAYPFAAIVGQEKMKLALILNVINPALSGVLIRGDKGTAKSTAVRSLAEILPVTRAIGGFPFNLDPDSEYEDFLAISAMLGLPKKPRDQLDITEQTVRVVELPIGATEDRVVGTLDIEHALQKGKKRIEPGLLSQAHRNILYVDEVNLLDDHVVDILLDVAAMGVNTIEREGISFSHPARFTLVGTMNPEEGELRPQLLDRFGLCVNISGITSLAERVQIMEQRIAFDRDPDSFREHWRRKSEKLGADILKARKKLPLVNIEQDLLYEISRTCMEVGVDGHRGDIIILKTARTLAAWHDREQVIPADIQEAVELALPHRIRRQPFMEIPDSIRQFRAEQR